MSNILLVLAIFKFIFSACSDNTAETACTDASCEWLPESCVVLAASECSSTSCHDNCPQTPEARGNCTDPNAACPSKTSASDCTGPGCNWGSGTCKDPVSPPTCEPVMGGCPTGCVDASYGVCSKKISYKCDGESTTPSTTNVCSSAKCTVGATCTHSGSRATLCGSLSVSEIITECTVWSDYNCKLSGSGSAKTCVVNPAGDWDEADQGDVDKCASFSVSSLSDCTRSAKCKATGTVCEKKTPEEVCNTYSISECEDSENLDPCVVNGSLCSYDTFPCEWNTAGTQCNAESISHGCMRSTISVCTNKNCISYSNSDCTAPCSWDPLTPHCSIATPLSCVSKSDGSCSPGSTGCVSENYEPLQCNPPTVTAATCEALNSSGGCSGVVGCKWQAVGKCVDKQSEGSWIKKNWWVILVIVLAVVVVVAVIVTVTLLKVKKKACFATAKVGVRDNSSNEKGDTAPPAAEADTAPPAGTDTGN